MVSAELEGIFSKTPLDILYGTISFCSSPDCTIFTNLCTSVKVSVTQENDNHNLHNGNRLLLPLLQISARCNTE